MPHCRWQLSLLSMTVVSVPVAVISGASGCSRIVPDRFLSGVRPFHQFLATVYVRSDEGVVFRPSDKSRFNWVLDDVLSDRPDVLIVPDDLIAPVALPQAHLEFFREVEA